MAGWPSSPEYIPSWATVVRLVRPLLLRNHKDVWNSFSLLRGNGQWRRGLAMVGLLLLGSPSIERPLWWLVCDGVCSNGATEFLRCSTMLRLGRKRWWSGVMMAGSEARVCGPFWWNWRSSGWLFIGFFSPRPCEQVGLYLQADLDRNRFWFGEEFVGNKDLPLGFGSSQVVTGEDDGRGRLGRWAVCCGRPGREVGQKWTEEMGCVWGRQSGL
jgi:hypothetical protein